MLLLTDRHLDRSTADLSPAELLERVRRFLGRLARDRAPGLGLDPDDVFQEAALVVLRTARAYDPDRGSPLTFARFAVRSAVTRLMKQRRRYSREVVAETVEGGLLVENLPGPDGSPDDDAVELGEVTAALVAVEALPPRWRFVVRRHLGIGGREPETFELMGEAIGVSGARAAVLFGQAMRRLRRGLAVEAPIAE